MVNWRSFFGMRTSRFFAARNALAALGILAGISVTPPARASTRGLVSRYTSAGILDATFNGQGFVTSASSSYAIDKVAVDGTGKIVTCGSSYDSAGKFSIVITRMNPDGSSDTSFGWLGAATVPWAASARTVSCAIDSSNRIVLAAKLETASWLVARLANGVPDSTFGNGGSTETRFDSSSAGHVDPTDLKLAPDGKIIVSGMLSGRAIVVRYASNGTVDSGFGWLGAVAVPDDVARTLEVGTHAVRVAVDSSGRPIVVGASPFLTNGGTPGCRVIRFTTAGALDTSFNSSGVQTFWVPGRNFCESAGVGLDRSGRLVVAAYAANITTTVPRSTSSELVALARLKPSGVLDTTFDGDGMVSTVFDRDTPNTVDLALTSDDRPVVLGSLLTTQPLNDTGSTGSRLRVVVLRYGTAGALDNTFGIGGLVLTEYAPSRAFPASVTLDASGRPLVAGLLQ
jgi:uncharacterized delta-60 repeat protein